MEDTLTILIVAVIILLGYHLLYSRHKCEFPKCKRTATNEWKVEVQSRTNRDNLNMLHFNLCTVHGILGKIAGKYLEEGLRELKERIAKGEDIFRTSTGSQA